MKPLDVITSVDFGYRLVWAEREYLVRLGLVPVIIKLMMMGLILLFGWPQESIRSTMIMLPAFLAYGWMFSHLTRLVFYGQRWPFRPTGNATADGVMLQDRAFGISAGTLYYAITGYLLSGLNAYSASLVPGMKAQVEANNQMPQDPSLLAGFAALGFLMFSLWMVRFLVLYIPAAAGKSVKPIIRTKFGMLMSLQIIGIALVCFIPVALLAWGFLGMLLSLVGQGSDLSAGQMVFGNIWLVVWSTVGQMIVAAGIAYGIKVMMSEKDKP